MFEHQLSPHTATVRASLCVFVYSHALIFGQFVQAVEFVAHTRCDCLSLPGAALPHYSELYKWVIGNKDGSIVAAAGVEMVTLAVWRRP